MRNTRFLAQALLLGIASALSITLLGADASAAAKPEPKHPVFRGTMLDNADTLWTNIHKWAQLPAAADTSNNGGVTFSSRRHVSFNKLGEYFIVDILITSLSSGKSVPNAMFVPAQSAQEPDLPEHYRLPAELVDRLENWLLDERINYIDRRLQILDGQKPEAYMRSFVFNLGNDQARFETVIRGLVDEVFQEKPPFRLSLSEQP